MSREYQSQLVSPLNPALHPRDDDGTEAAWLGNPVRTSAQVQLDAIRRAVREEVTRAIAPLRADATATVPVVSMEIVGEHIYAVTILGEGSIGTVRYRPEWRTWTTNPLALADCQERATRLSAVLALVNQWAEEANR